MSLEDLKRKVKERAGDGANVNEEPQECVAAVSRARSDAEQAPAGRQKMIKALKPSTMQNLLSLLTDDDLRRAVEVQREAMDATSRMWDMIEKQWVILPDHKTRTAASALILAYREGLPVARQAIIKGEFDDAGAQVERAMRSPELRRHLQAMLDRSTAIEAEVIQQSGGEKPCSTPEAGRPSGGGSENERLLKDSCDGETPSA